MDKPRIIIEQLRVESWIKNLIIFIPLFFSSEFTVTSKLSKLVLAFLVFSISTGMVYIINDLKDFKDDARHKEKKKRPLPSGRVSKKGALLLLISIAAITSLGLIWLNSSEFNLILLSYLLLNLAYTFFIKKIPLWDILFIGLMYLLRVYLGASVVNIQVSGWLFVTVFFGSLLLILAKRLAELRNGATRKVLNYYSKSFLRNLLFLSAAISLTAFSVYSINLGNNHLLSIIIFTFIIFRYLYLIDFQGKGEQPVALLLSDRQILFSALFFVLYNTYQLYL